MPEAPVELRAMTRDDLDDVMALHIASWRATYAGMLDDAWLAGPVASYMRDAWHGRLVAAEARGLGIAARQAGELAGFVFAIPGCHAELGTLVDNLHVSPHRHGHGIGTRLLAELAAVLADEHGEDGVYLEALEANEQACRYYRRLGATVHRRFRDPMPDGQVHWSLEFTWPSVSSLTSAFAPRT